MKIVFKRTRRRDTLELHDFCKEPGDPNGLLKQTLYKIIENFPDYIKYITIDVTTGTDSMNMRPRFTRWLTPDERIFGTWSKKQLKVWMEEHQVCPEFRSRILNESVYACRKWVRVLDSNEKLISYYTKLGFSVAQNWLLPHVKMRSTPQIILEHIAHDF